MTRTTDGGLTWAWLDPLIAASPVFVSATEGWVVGVVAEDADPDHVTYSRHGVYRTVDGGETWLLEFPTRGRLRHTTHAVAARAVWVYGHDAMYRRGLRASTDVSASHHRPTRWGALKRQDQE